ncbi:helix-turn-helix domain-containing protein [Ligilactobacillus ruminis]|uniref:helix-turn-helix domain-containing protein n=1 Tax=Ligilactobacillus ruminis TaxID=1623 RepID=UPI0022E8A3F6|nr:helix-turn-helix domain-containing protein [Ligilactobacillus ruminis]
MVLKAFKLRLYPNKTQRNQIHVNLGCARFVWNQMLNMHIERYKNNKKAEFQGRYSMDVMLKALKIEYFYVSSKSKSRFRRRFSKIFQP